MIGLRANELSSNRNYESPNWNVPNLFKPHNYTQLRYGQYQKIPSEITAVLADREVLRIYIVKENLTHFSASRQDWKVLKWHWAWLKCWDGWKASFSAEPPTSSDLLSLPRILGFLLVYTTDLRVYLGSAPILLRKSEQIITGWRLCSSVFRQDWIERSEADWNTKWLTLQDQEGPEECSMQGCGWLRKAHLAVIEKKTVEKSVLEPSA